VINSEVLDEQPSSDRLEFVTADEFMRLLPRPYQVSVRR
jgi:hypothetical protein